MPQGRAAGVCPLPVDVDRHPGGGLHLGDLLVHPLDRLLRLVDALVQVVGEATGDELLEQAAVVLGEAALALGDLIDERVDKGRERLLGAVRIAAHDEHSVDVLARDLELARVDPLPQRLVVAVEGVHQVLAAAAGGESLRWDACEELQPAGRVPGKRLLAGGCERAVAQCEREQIAADVGRE